MTTKSKYPEPQDVTPEIRLANNRLLVTLTIVGLSLLFGCLIYANFMVRNAQGQWPPLGVDRMNLGIPLAMTIILIASSATAILGMRALKEGQRNRMLTFFSVTSALGLIYAVWMLDFMFNILRTFNGVYSAMFLALWFVHVLHALAVLGLMGYVIMNARRGKYSVEEGYFPVEAANNLWHFLTIVWIVLFLVLYFV